MIANALRRMRPWSTALLLWLAPLSFLALFYIYPLGTILSLSLARETAGMTAPLQQIAASPHLRNVVWFTVWQAVVSTALTLVVGMPGAYLLARYRFPGKSLVQSLAGIPFVMPTLVVAAAFNALLGPQGWINLATMAVFHLVTPPFEIVNTLGAILLAHVFYNTTIVLRLVGDFWSRMDPRLGQAAAVLGANPWAVLRQVTLPLLSPAVAAAALLVFIFDFTSFGVIMVLGGPRFATLEVEIYTQTVSLFNLPLAAALSLLQLACTLSLTVIYTRLTRRVERPQPLRPAGITQQPLNTWQARLFAGVVLGLLLVLTTLPLIALAVRSVTRLETVRGRDEAASPGLTLDYYYELGVNRRESLFYASPVTSILISLGYAAATVALALALGLPASWALANQDRPGAMGGVSQWLARWMDPLLMLPLGTSAVTLGLGFIVALDHPPLNLRASPLLIPLAHTLVAFPFVVRSLVPALRSIRPRLHQAAAVLGATPWQVFHSIDLPLAGRALLVAATFSFTISLGEFGATALVARPEFPTLPLAIYRLIGQPGAMNYGQALALSTILMLVSASGMLVIERLRIAEVGEF